MRITIPFTLLFMLTTGAAAQASPDLTRFAWRLFAATCADGKNACLSPWSAAMALAMTRAGARGNTATELDAALGIEGDGGVRLIAESRQAILPKRIPDWSKEDARREVDAYELRAANAAFVRAGFALQPDYTRTLDDLFAARPQQVDFRQQAEARALINGWVEAETKARIRNLLADGQPPADSGLVLVSCLYLAAQWQEAFAERATTEKPFTLAHGESVGVPTMHRTDHYDYGDVAGAHIVRLPFRDHDLGFVLIVPKDGSKLAAVQGELAQKWDDLVAQLAGRQVALSLPRFRIEMGASLVEPLQAMGVRDAFDAKRADFSGMSSEAPLFIGAVVQKTFVRVDEHGTEAAAATAVMMRLTSEMNPDEPIAVRADRPFLFAIHHRRAGLLFLGRVADPR